MNVDEANIALAPLHAADVSSVEVAGKCQLLLRKAALQAQRAHSCPELLLKFLGWFGEHGSNRNSHEDHESTDFTYLSAAGSESVNSGEFPDMYSKPCAGREVPVTRWVCDRMRSLGRKVRERHRLEGRLPAVGERFRLPTPEMDRFQIGRRMSPRKHRCGQESGNCTVVPTLETHACSRSFLFPTARRRAC